MIRAPGQTASRKLFPWILAVSVEDFADGGCLRDEADDAHSFPASAQHRVGLVDAADETCPRFRDVRRRRSPVRPLTRLPSRDFETPQDGSVFFVRLCTPFFLFGRAGPLVLPILFLFWAGMRCLEHNLQNSRRMGFDVPSNVAVSILNEVGRMREGCP